MTQDEIIEMAREAGMETNEGFSESVFYFAKLVAEKERNEILKMCEPPEHSHQFVHTFKKIIAARGLDKSHWGCEVRASWCSEAIRAREKA